MTRMPRHAGLTTGACVLLAAVGCGRPHGHAVSASHRRPVDSGLTFTVRMAGTSFGGRPSRTDSIATQFRDGVLRVDLPSAPDPRSSHRSASGFYLLVNTTAKTATVVMPASRQYWETRLDSTARQRANPTVVISDIDVSGSTIGSGGTVNGYATTRYRITTRYTETPSHAGSEQRRKKVHVVEDVWVPNALDGVPDPVQAYMRVFPLSSTVGELFETQATARRKLFSGLPVRTTWKLTQSSDGGGTAWRSLTIDILHLKRADLDPAAFRVPDGYGRFDLAARLEAVELLLKEAKKESAETRKKP